MNSGERTIVQGISLSTSGEARVDPGLSDVLFDYALSMEEATDLPVDVEHVLAAIVLAAKREELSPATVLTSGDAAIQQLLLPHVKMVFAVFGGDVGSND